MLRAECSILVLHCRVKASNPLAHQVEHNPVNRPGSTPVAAIKLIIVLGVLVILRIAGAFGLVVPSPIKLPDRRNADDPALPPSVV